MEIGILQGHDIILEILKKKKKSLEKEDFYLFSDLEKSYLKGNFKVNKDEKMFERTLFQWLLTNYI